MLTPSSSPPNPLAKAANALVKLLQKREVSFVCAESCTCGMVAAALGGISGVSRWFCGSAVTYQEATKTAWLDVSSEDLAKHSAVSEPVARQMALAVLKNTPQAGWSASITGYLGPEAPQGMNGIVFIGIGRRMGKDVAVVEVARRKLTAKTRAHRQLQAATFVLRQLQAAIKSTTPKTH